MRLAVTDYNGREWFIAKNGNLTERTTGPRTLWCVYRKATIWDRLIYWYKRRQPAPAEDAPS